MKKIGWATLARRITLYNIKTRLLLFTVFEQASDSWTTFRFRRPGAALPDCRPTGWRCVLVPKDTSDNSASRAHLVLDTNQPAVVLSRRASRVTVTVMPPSATLIQVTRTLYFVPLCNCHDLQHYYIGIRP